MKKNYHADNLDNFAEQQGLVFIVQDLTNMIDSQENQFNCKRVFSYSNFEYIISILFKAN